MAISVAISELLSDPAALVHRVVGEQETVVLVEGDRPVAEIRPVTKPKSERTLGEVFAALPHLTPEEAEAFGRDIDEGREAANRVPVRDPWES
jgi:antitoxin (DNA-binding transcriptional repressor) of toxin-antitoxin stability system